VAVAVDRGLRFRSCFNSRNPSLGSVVEFSGAATRLPGCAVAQLFGTTITTIEVG
jgi:hypothetical protein